MPRCCTWNSVASTTHADRSPQLRRRVGRISTETPAFTQPITPGIAVGEHLPSLGSSFGSSRCRFVAEGIVEPMSGASAGSPIASQPSRAASLTTASTSTPRTAPRDRRRPMRSDAFLEVAARLAHEVATTAIWCDRRCNWVAAVEGSRASGRAQGHPRTRPLRWHERRGAVPRRGRRPTRRRAPARHRPRCDSAGPRPGRPDRHPGPRRALQRSRRSRLRGRPRRRTAGRRGRPSPSVRVD